MFVSFWEAFHQPPIDPGRDRLAFFFRVGADTIHERDIQSQRNGNGRWLFHFWRTL